MISRETVEHVAALARLGLTDAEIDRMREQLSHILATIEQLRDVDTSQVGPTASVIALENVMRDDVAAAPMQREATLAQRAAPRRRLPPGANRARGGPLMELADRTISEVTADLRRRALSQLPRAHRGVPGAHRARRPAAEHVPPAVAGRGGPRGGRRGRPRPWRPGGTRPLLGIPYALKDIFVTRALADDGTPLPRVACRPRPARRSWSATGHPTHPTPSAASTAPAASCSLDEIGELPQALQANLLRVLDEGGEYHCLGGLTTKRSRFRLLGATNREVTSLKHDLAARLVLRLEVPGLDARRDDIPCLTGHLLRRAVAKSPEAVRRFTTSSGQPRIKASLLDHLLGIGYATHIRELDTMLWRAMSESTGDAIEWHRGAAASEPVRPPSSPDELASRPEATKAAAAPEPDEAEIRARLGEHRGNVARAARALGLSSRYVLYRLMRKHGIEE